MSDLDISVIKILISDYGNCQISSRREIQYWYLTFLFRGSFW
jgi:hypothetical protein